MDQKIGETSTSRKKKYESQGYMQVQRPNGARPPDATYGNDVGSKPGLDPLV